MATNLPPKIIQDSAAGTKLFFEAYGEVPVSFNANEIDAVIGFFTSAGFGKDAAIVSGLALLKQAKIDETPIFTILDQIKEFNQIQISALVGEILNNNRVPLSTLGYRQQDIVTNEQQRNIGA